MARNNKDPRPAARRDIRLVCCTGGVLSSLGKGITAASLGNLLKARGYNVGMMKFDPYINVDPGTMSPFQHGEVYVTADGAETDLDLGHYERFLDVEVARRHNITAGQVYDAVIRRERAGDYLGKTVQVIPHITDEIKSRILEVAEEYEVLIIEIGGTVGDIESLPFLEAVRQLRRELARRNRSGDGQGTSGIFYAHLTLVPYHRASGEMKTKPTQHSVAALRQIGIQPQALLCRSEAALDQDVKEKIALFADLDADEVISVPDVSSIYRVPLVLREADFDGLVIRTLGLPDKPIDMSRWEAFIANLEQAEPEVKIGVIGKYVELRDAYKSIEAALVHAGAGLKTRVKPVWIDAESIERGTADLSRLDGIIVPGGFGERGIEGKIMAIKAAREGKLPFLGICLGLQCAVIEFARHVTGLEHAHSVEFDEETAHPVIHIMAAQRHVRQKGGTMRLGSYPCRLRSGTLAHRLYQKYAGVEGDEITERHRHRYEVNNAYRDRLAEGGMIFSGLSPDGLLVEMVEYPPHPFFIAAQFHPEFKSRPLAPHPLFTGLVQAALDRQKK